MYMNIYCTLYTEKVLSKISKSMYFLRAVKNILSPAALNLLTTQLYIHTLFMVFTFGAVRVKVD